MFTHCFYRLFSHSLCLVGTAAVISPVNKIGYLGEDIHIPTGPDGMGPVSRPIWKQLVGIQIGDIKHPWSVVVTE